MTQTMRQQFSIPKPDDRFAADMLRQLAAKYHAPECSSLRVKVVHYRSLEGWMELYSLARAGRDPDRLSREFREVPEMKGDEWRKTNAFLSQVAMQNTVTGKTRWDLNEKQREQSMVEHGLRAELANALSPFDAVIFVNHTNIRQAFEAGQPFPLHVVLTHECIHIIERRTGQTIIKNFDARHRYLDDESAKALERFLSEIGQQEFTRRYLSESWRKVG